MPRAAVPGALVLGLDPAKWEDIEAFDTPERESCERFYGEMVDTLEQLAKRGVNWFDIHHGNVGVDSKGVWKGLDLGVSGTGAAPDVPALKGAAPRKISGTFCETTKNPRRFFDARSFRYIPRGKNWLLIGCPKGKWDDRTNSCKVGTRAYKVLKKTDRCPVGRRVTKG